MNILPSGCRLLNKLPFGGKNLLGIKLENIRGIISHESRDSLTDKQLHRRLAWKEISQNTLKSVSKTHEKI